MHTAMQRLPFLGILCYLCISNLLTLQVFSDGADSLAAGVCDTATSLTKCANLSLSYPFGAEPPCTASDTFLISNCSSDQVYWYGFEKASPAGDDKLGAPALTGFLRISYFSFINLTWNIDMMLNDACHAPMTADVVNFVPDTINLANLANESIQFSSYNYFLLLNCSNQTQSMANVMVDSPICLAYKSQCIAMGNVSCAQLKVTQELQLHQALDNLSCTHFQSLVTSNNTNFLVSQWSTGMIQLLYSDGVQCEACITSGGQCMWNTSTGTFKECTCGDKSSDTDCQHIPRCKGYSCTGVKIAIGVSSTVVATVLCMMVLFWVYQRKRRYSTKSFPSSSSNRLLTYRAYMLSKKFGPASTKEFSFESLSKATKSFADENMIGDGGFGAVYLGILKDGRKVAIKRLYHDNFRRMDHFYNEIKILSSLDHPHLVKLYGFCCQDSNDLLLVFEYASNGTVFDQLHDATKPAMPWRTRLNIARETAEALAYLHSSVSPPIYHRDVKTTNILLDDDLSVKLADFGLSRLVPLEATHVSTAPQGTPGYLDPDYHQCYQLTDKSDVYSFGVVLVELVSAKLAVDMSRDRREINLSNLALMKIGCGAWEDLVDPCLEMKKSPDVEMMVKRVVELAFMCLNAEKDNRPTMKYVAEALASMCKEFGYSFHSVFSMKMDMNGLSPIDETSHLIKTSSKSKSRSTVSRDSIPSSDWTSSNESSHVNSL